MGVDVVARGSVELWRGMKAYELAEGVRRLAGVGEVSGGGDGRRREGRSGSE